MESTPLQDYQHLISALLEYPNADNSLLIHMLERVINFHHLTESTIYLIWYYFRNNEKIMSRIPKKYLKDDWWYELCEGCIVDPHDSTCSSCYDKFTETLVNGNKCYERCFQYNDCVKGYCNHLNGIQLS